MFCNWYLVRLGTAIRYRDLGTPCLVSSDAISRSSRVAIASKVVQLPKIVVRPRNLDIQINLVLWNAIMIATV